MKRPAYRGTPASPSTLKGLSIGAFVGLWWFAGGLPLAADEALPKEPANAEITVAARGEQEAAEPAPPKPLPDPKDATRMNPKARVWVDRKRGVVMVDGSVSLRRGVLEMFACPTGTKEHESIVAVDSPAFLVHAALLSVGAKPGKPVQWDPEYAPPSGDRIDIAVEWRKEGKGDGAMQSADARQWIRDLRRGKPMQQHWVFAGSGFWKDEQSGREYYLAESGDMICVSNFGTAMLDIPDNSPQTTDGLLFEAFTERIPPLGTPVRLVLTPKPNTLIKRKTSKGKEELNNELKKQSGEKSNPPAK